MKACKWPLSKKKDPCEIEKKIQTAKDLIAENNLRLDELIATVNGEDGWMLEAKRRRKDKPPDIKISTQGVAAC